MDIIPAKSSKSFTKDAIFENYLWTVDDYSRIIKMYGIENITTEEVMDKLDMFQEIFGKLDEFGWCYMERIQTDAGTKFTSKESQ